MMSTLLQHPCVDRRGLDRLARVRRAQRSRTDKRPQPGGFLEHEAVTPPLLFREVWQQPPHTGALNDENRRITPQALTNPELELQLYGTDAAQHPGDLAQRHSRSVERLHDLARGTHAEAQGRLPRSDRPHEDALEDAHGESARAASGREARGRQAARRQPDVREPAAADDGSRTASRATSWCPR